MSTRSAIGIVNSDNTITAIYCHWAGNPAHNGKILVNHYSDETKVRELISIGDLSSLGEVVGEKTDFDTPKKGQCIYYGRDRGDAGVDCKQFPSLSSVKSFYDASDYFYIFEDGEWTCRNDVNKMIPLGKFKKA